jgi:hypothetical protein
MRDLDEEQEREQKERLNQRLIEKYTGGVSLVEDLMKVNAHINYLYHNVLLTSIQWRELEDLRNLVKQMRDPS